ncbi:MAG TPA: class I SAM-dependent methyltransferase [Fimbriiglobus sp.]|nr:class I SAM-dependent methyltransferase [Fimbriiglobus sp.]
MTVAHPDSWPVNAAAASALAAYARAVEVDPAVEWQMQPGEQAALIALLHGLRPKVAVEIGSRYGGSMQVLARYAERVISVDIDPTCRDRLGPRHPNAEFVTGDSRLTFPPLMKRLEQERAEVGFILIDGDHTATGVQADIRGLLDYRPSCPLFVVMHDSFNPPVRQGIRTAPWSQSRYVHSVELDFVHGIMVTGGEEDREMWGGLALAVLLPEPRTGPLAVTARLERLFRLVYRRSVHWPLDPPALTRRVIRKCQRMAGLI